MDDGTRVLHPPPHGEAQAGAELLPVVYNELRRLAQSKMTGERPGQTLQATALVHEAWLRLAASGRERWKSRTQFFLAAAEAMRRILIDHARRKASQKRGGAQPFEELDESCIAARAPTEEILAVHEALDALAHEDPMSAEVVKLRYFVGMSIPEVAEALQIAPRTADRHWAFARVWLKRAIEGDPPRDPGVTTSRA